MFAHILALALAVVAAPSGERDGASPAAEEVAASDQQPLLLAIQLEGLILSEAMQAFGDPSDPLLPVGELSRLLELPIMVEPSKGQVTGHIGESRGSVSVDVLGRTALVGGRRLSLTDEDVKVSETEIYIRASLLAKLIPVDFAPSADDLLITLRAREKLPVLINRERGYRIAGLALAPSEQDETPMQVDTPYQWLSRPAFDLSLELGADSDRSRAITRLEGRIAADVAKSLVIGYLATDEAGHLSSARVRAERRSVSADMLGPLHASYVAAGDVYSPALPLGPRSVGGAGFSMSSAPPETASVFERTDLRGDLPIGYDAELYVNDVLRRAQDGARTRGRYDFRDVRLVRGRNIIKLVLYGPRGEREEQTRIINVGGGQMPAGQTIIDAGLIFQNREVFGLSGGQSRSRTNGEQPRAVLSVSYGLTTRLTISSGVGLYADDAGVGHEVVTIGARTTVLGAALQGDFASDLDGGSAVSLGAAGSLLGANLLVRHVEYSGAFADEPNVAWDLSRPLRRYSEVTLDASVPILGAGRLPVFARADRAEYIDGGTTTTARARTSTSLAGALFTIGADYSRRIGPGYRVTRLTGTSAVSALVDYKWQLRAHADYDISPRCRLRSLGLTADRSLGDRYTLRFGAIHTFGKETDVALEAGLTAHLPFTEATVGGNYSTSEKRWRVGLQLSFGLIFDPNKRRYRATPPGPANGGSVAVQAFVDNNANGHRERSEAAVSGVQIQGVTKPVTTDAEGFAFFTGLGESSSAMLRVDTSQTNAALFGSSAHNVAFIARPGNVARVNYAIVPTSEVTVRVSFRQPDGKLAGLSAVRLRLVTASGMVASAVTEFDGTAVFESVKPGKYKLELDENQARALQMSLAFPVGLAVNAEGSADVVKSEVVFSKADQQ